MMLFILSAGVVCLASAAGSPRFDAASIAVNRSGTVSYLVKAQASPEPVKLTMRNVSLRLCLQQAYSVKEYQVSGPGWIKKAKYDIMATLAPGSMPDQIWPALQELLGERLKVSIRREKRELPIYALTVGKNGLKLRAAGEGDPQDGALGPGDHPSASLHWDRASLDQFTDWLSHDLKRPVLNETGVAGKFEFNLHYAKHGDQSGPSIFAALERQLGLRLEPRKGLVEILIVQSAVRLPQ
jgi:uncharacterized protein (TIGR03435 family)